MPSQRPVHQNSTKYEPKRGLKLKDTERKARESVQAACCSGVCRRCCEVVRFKFQYDKYKPLKRPGRCANCRQFKCTLPWRTLCNGCASAKGDDAKKGACPMCAKLWTEIQKADAAAARAKPADAVDEASAGTADDDESVEADDDVAGKDADVASTMPPDAAARAAASLPADVPSEPLPSTPGESRVAGPLLPPPPPQSKSVSDPPDLPEEDGPAQRADHGATDSTVES